MEWYELMPIVPDDSSGEVPHADAREWMRRASRELAERNAECERMEDALRKIKSWAEAYPVSVFPEPDFARVYQVLTAAGLLTLDAVSASNMRHVITGVQRLVSEGLGEEEGTT